MHAIKRPRGSLITFNSISKYQNIGVSLSPRYTISIQYITTPDHEKYAYPVRFSFKPKFFIFVPCFIIFVLPNFKLKKSSIELVVEIMCTLQTVKLLRCLTRNILSAQLHQPKIYFHRFELQALNGQYI